MKYLNNLTITFLLKTILLLIFLFSGVSSFSTSLPISLPTNADYLLLKNIVERSTSNKSDLNDYDQLGMLIYKKKINLNYRFDQNKTALMMVKDSSFADLLINSGADVNAFDQLGRSVLSYAVINKSSLIIDFLLAKKVDLNKRDYQGDTALDLILENKDSESILTSRKLIKNGIDVNGSNKSGKSTLDRAYKSGDKEIIRMIESKTGKLDESWPVPGLISIQKVLKKTSDTKLDKNLIDFFKLPNKEAAIQFLNHNPISNLDLDSSKDVYYTINQYCKHASQLNPPDRTDLLEAVIVDTVNRRNKNPTLKSEKYFDGERPYFITSCMNDLGYQFKSNNIVELIKAFPRMTGEPFGVHWLKQDMFPLALMPELKLIDAIGKEWSNEYRLKWIAPSVYQNISDCNKSENVALDFDKATLFKVKIQEIKKINNGASVLKLQLLQKVYGEGALSNTEIYWPLKYLKKIG